MTHANSQVGLPTSQIKHNFYEVNVYVSNVISICLFTYEQQRINNYDLEVSNRTIQGNIMFLK